MTKKGLGKMFSMRGLRICSPLSKQGLQEDQEKLVKQIEMDKSLYLQLQQVTKSKNEVDEMLAAQSHAMKSFELRIRELEKKNRNLSNTNQSLKQKLEQKLEQNSVKKQAAEDKAKPHGVSKIPKLPQKTVVLNLETILEEKENYLRSRLANSSVKSTIRKVLEELSPLEQEYPIQELANHRHGDQQLNPSVLGSETRSLVYSDTNRQKETEAPKDCQSKRTMTNPMSLVSTSRHYASDDAYFENE